MFEQKADKKDIQAIVKRYIRHWHYFAIALAISVAGALIYLRYAPPLYQATTTVLFKGEGNEGGLSESTAFNDLELLNSNRSIDNEMLIIKSNSLMEQVVSQLSLDIVYVIEGRVRDVEIYGDEVPFKMVINEVAAEAYGKSFEIRFRDDRTFELVDDGRTIFGFGEEIVKPYARFTLISKADFTFSEENKPITVRFKDKSTLAKGLANKLNVKTVNSKASVLNISIIDQNAKKAEDILAKVIEVYEGDNVEDKNQIARKTVDFIDDRLDFLTQELNKVEQNVETYKQEKDVTDVSSQAQEYVATASANRKELEQVGIQLANLRQIEDYLQSQSGDRYSLVPSTLSITDATLSGLIATYNQLQLDRERVLRSAQITSPVVLNITEQLKNLRINMLENLKNIKISLDITRRTLLAKSGAVGNQLQQVPVIERQLIEITRQQEIKKAIYLYLLQKKEESALSLAATVSNTRVVDPPKSVGKVSPNKLNTLAYAVILSLFIAALVVYLKNLLTDTIELRQDVERSTATPILGEICHSDAQTTVVTGRGERTPVAEMFRLLRSNLHFAVVKKKSGVMLITSSESGEGKTFFSINMANSLAEGGKKVILLELDLRRPAVLKALDIKAKKGITDYLVGDVTNFNDVVIPFEGNPNLSIAPAGTIPPNPSELLMEDELSNLINGLKGSYDYVILDTPPVGKVADSLNLGELADISIFIVRFNYTRKEQLKIIDDIFTLKKLNNPFIVLNDSKKINSTAYAYGY